MISFIRGIASEITENTVIIENHGIGYEIFMTGGSLSRIHVGEEYKIHTYFQDREDAMQLYGFLAKDDLQVLRLLLGVNAVGILSGITADELRFAVLSEDVKTISKAPGIGKKTAQKLILELKDKLSVEAAFDRKLAHEQENAAAGLAESADGRQEAALALIALG